MKSLQNADHQVTKTSLTDSEFYHYKVCITNKMVKCASWRVFSSCKKLTVLSLGLSITFNH